MTEPKEYDEQDSMDKFLENILERVLNSNKEAAQDEADSD